MSPEKTSTFTDRRTDLNQSPKYMRAARPIEANILEKESKDSKSRRAGIARVKVQ